MTSRETFHTFDNDAEAIAYRDANGLGGWIAVNPDKGDAVLFPYGWTPSRVFAHPMAAWSNGCRLVGCIGRDIQRHEWLESLERKRT